MKYALVQKYAQNVVMDFTCKGRNAWNAVKAVIYVKKKIPVKNAKIGITWMENYVKFVMILA